MLQFMQYTSQLGPAGMMAVNQDRAIEFVADRLGVPPSLLSTQEEREQLMAEMQMAMQQEQQAEAEPPIE